MVRHLRHRVSAWVVTLGLVGSGSAFAYAPQAHAKSPETVQNPQVSGASTYRVAVVKVTVREANGRTYRARTRAVRWGDLASFDVVSDLHRHNVEFRAADDSKVRLSYTKDGGTAAQRTASTSRRNTQVFNADGATLEVTIIPTVVSVDVD